jgi:hypothetical protein
MNISNASSKAFMTVLLVFAVDLTVFASPDETRRRMHSREHDGLRRQDSPPSDASSGSR